MNLFHREGMPQNLLGVYYNVENTYYIHFLEAKEVWIPKTWAFG